MSPLTLLTSFLLIASALGAPELESVPSLPSFGVPPSPMWSGFLDAENGTKLHYWYSQMEGTDTPAGAGSPVVLWLNGGPGSSSILGMLQEMGPVLINSTGGLMANPYAWTKQANLLVLESPGGVGYSYCAAMLEGGNCHNTDISTAADARAALQDFFTAKFPELSSSPLYITGESYAGVYIPTLADEVLRNAPEIVLKGIAVGDPCTDTPAQSEGFDMLWYSHKHGFVPDDDFAFLSQNCSYDAQKTFLSRGYWKRENGQWATPPTHRLSREMRSNKALADACELAERKFLMTTSKGLSQGWDGAYINELDLFTDAAALDWTLPGTLNFYNAEWMNRDDVKEALHVTDAPVDSWPGPSDGWTYTSNWNACNDAPDADSMIQFYQKIAPQLDRTIVFNGDVDPCVTYEGTRNAIQQVGFDVLPGGSYRPWFFNKTATTVPLLEEKPSLFGVDLELGEAGPQFGGHVVNYEHGLTFATIHGAGHMVPQFMPLKGSRLLAQLLMSADDNDNHYPFAPPLPTDEEIAAMSWSEFDAAVDEWTDSAEAFVDSDA